MSPLLLFSPLAFPLRQMDAEKMVQALAERSGEVQFLRQRLVGKESGRNPAAEDKLLLQKDKQPFQVGIVTGLLCPLHGREVIAVAGEGCGKRAKTES